MPLTLEPKEVALLERVLTNDLADLREEIYKTENYDLRMALHEDERIMKSLLERLRPITAAA
jgi:hypothetical protein